MVAAFGVGAIMFPTFFREAEIAPVKLSDWLLVIFNFLLAVFTAFLWYSTQALWRVTRDMGERQSLDTRVLQRAYVSTKGRDIAQIGNGLVGHIVIRNVGRLPATNVRWFIDMTDSNDPDWRPPTVGESQLVPAGILSIDAKVVRGGPPRQISQLQYWYLWGLITYVDGFGEERFTQFCHRYNTGTRYAPSGGGYILPGNASRQHEFGNEAN